MGDDRFAFFGELFVSLQREIEIKPSTQWLRTNIKILALKTLQAAMVIIIAPVVLFTIGGPIICITESASRLAKQDYVIGNDDASKANMKPALNLFYCVSLAHGAVCSLCIFVELAADEKLAEIVSQRHGLNTELLDGYFQATKQMCVNNPASTDSWNLITYGANLLDSQLPEDCSSGGRVLTMLIDQGMSLSVRWLLIRSPRQRVQKMIGTLAWRSPAEREMRWFAARIVEQLASHLNLAHFPGALECISSLFNTSCHNNGDQEALHLPFVIGRSKSTKRKGFLAEIFNNHRKVHSSFQKGRVPWPSQLDGGLKKVPKEPLVFMIWVCYRLVRKIIGAPKNSGTRKQDSKQVKNGERTDEDLILPGLRILENLAHDEYNCTLIYSTKDLVSRVIAPVSSNELIEDTKGSLVWTKLVDGSLKVVSRLMGSSGSTGEDMCSQIGNNSNAVNNLEAILDMDMKSNSSIIELKMRAIEVLTQLALHHPATTSATRRREKLIERALPIFLTKDWMVDYLKDAEIKIEKPTTDRVKRKMEEAQENARQLKEKAGEALAMLSSDSEAVKSFTGCDDDVRCLTELLDSKEINMSCRISAAVILKNLSNYVKEPTLWKALTELLHEQPEASSTARCWESLLPICCRNDIENPVDGEQDEPSVAQSQHIKQCEERRMQAELMSLIAAIRRNNNLDFAAILMSPKTPVPLEDFVVRLKKMVEDNMYATPACLVIQKITCEMILEFMKHDQSIEVIDKHNIVGTLLEASKAMAGLESSMLFAGGDRDCHGVPLKPLSSVLANRAQDLLTRKKQDLDINIAPAGVPSP